MKYLAEIFPRVTYVRLDYHTVNRLSNTKWPNPNDVWLIKVFPSLTKVHIINFPFRDDKATMDTLLTGIPFEIIEKGHHTAERKALSPALSHILRIQGNILQLKSNTHQRLIFLKI